MFQSSVSVIGYLSVSRGHAVFPVQLRTAPVLVSGWRSQALGMRQ
jgi:hypothetical protein